mgnify:CR=1 FL=1
MHLSLISSSLDLRESTIYQLMYCGVFFSKDDDIIVDNGNGILSNKEACVDVI